MYEFTRPPRHHAIAETYRRLSYTILATFSSQHRHFGHTALNGDLGYR
jgi:hypothetical protein